MELSLIPKVRATVGFSAKILSKEPAARFKLRVGAKVNDARAQEPLGLLANTWFVAIQPFCSEIIQI
jgi:hypothetical protein